MDSILLDAFKPGAAGPGTPRTLADLLVALDQIDLDPAQLRSLRSDIVCIAKVLKAAPDQIEANQLALLARLHKLHPREVGVSGKRLRNLRASLTRAMRLVGWSEKRNTRAFMAAWVALYKLLTDRFARLSLTRFIRFCSEHGITPEQVDDAVIRAFRIYLDEVDFCRGPATMERDTVRAWNRMVATIPTWPRTPSRCRAPTGIIRWTGAPSRRACRPTLTIGSRSRAATIPSPNLRPGSR